MQKMKNGLMMFCLTVLLSCAALMMNTPTASAMTLADLQGTYRIVRGDPCIKETIGSTISLAMENGELVGRVQRPSSNAKYWSSGDIFISDVFVDNGTVNMQLDNSYGTLVPGFMKIQSNGGTLKLFKNSLGEGTVIYELHRL